ncbi:phytoene desaturase family protein [Paenibacillus sp. M1]|uniref:4,4'-diaponeurosporene oxygenase n=1 Tax=Paenibacillus haidiansis TaxID=1574488 RepID=A0ABU7VWT4_9BACL
MGEKALIIGAGFSGLSCAIGLAVRGYEVTVLERQPFAGGKLQRVIIDGYRFDRGPTTIEMAHVFQSLFRLAGRELDDYVRLIPLEPRSRSVFADGSVVDLTGNVEHMQHQIGTYSPEDALHYPAFIQESRRMLRYANEHVLNRLPMNLMDKFRPLAFMGSLAPALHRSLHRQLRRHFTHPNTLAMFGRYAARTGSSPYKVSSLYGMLASSEADQGIHLVQGGTYELIVAMEKLARELGVAIETGVEVSRIRIVDRKVRGVETSIGDFESPLVVVNGDALSASRKLLDEKDRPSLTNHTISSFEPSLSAFVQLAGVPERLDRLHHHTVFFSENYEEEFQDIFVRRRPPVRPSVYICNSSYSEKEAAPPGCSNLFIMTHTPYLSAKWDWEREGEAYAENVFAALRRYGLNQLNRSHELARYTPEDVERDTYSYRGNMFGITSHNLRQNLRRPESRSRDIRGLWYAGGTTHPGGGVPFVALSGQLVAEHIAGSRTK